MSAPNRIRLKRRRDELPPNTLVVEERRQKRTLTESLYIRQANDSSSFNGHVALPEQPEKPDPANVPTPHHQHPAPDLPPEPHHRQEKGPR